MRRGFWFFRAIKFVIFLTLFLLIGGCITMSLWNWLIPELFNGPVITFWQTIGLLLLSKILLGGFGKGFCGGRGRRDKWGGRWNDKWQGNWNNECGGMSKEEWKERMQEKWKAKMEGMSEEDKEKFKEKFKKKFTITID